MKTGTPAPTAKRISIPAAVTKRRVAPHIPEVGFLLMDKSLSVVSFNAEAVRILGYPDDIERLSNSVASLTEEIRSRLITAPSPRESVFVTEFRSGGRHYFCRTFLVDAHNKDVSLPRIAVLLERGPSGLVSVSRVCEQFNVTQREQEVLEYLLQGISSNEIASRMNLSPNTVKAFLRLLTIKLGVSSRSAIVEKLVMNQYRLSLDGHISEPTEPAG